MCGKNIIEENVALNWNLEELFSQFLPLQFKF